MMSNNHQQQQQYQHNLLQGQPQAQQQVPAGMPMQQAYASAGQGAQYMQQNVSLQAVNHLRPQQQSNTSHVNYQQNLTQQPQGVLSASVASPAQQQQALLSRQVQSLISQQQKMNMPGYQNQNQNGVAKDLQQQQKEKLIFQQFGGTQAMPSQFANQNTAARLMEEQKSKQMADAQSVASVATNRLMGQQFDDKLRSQLSQQVNSNNMQAGANTSLHQAFDQTASSQQQITNPQMFLPQIAVKQQWQGGQHPQFVAGPGSNYLFQSATAAANGGVPQLIPQQRAASSTEQHQSSEHVLNQAQKLQGVDVPQQYFQPSTQAADMTKEIAQTAQHQVPQPIVGQTAAQVAAGLRLNQVAAARGQGTTGAGVKQMQPQQLIMNLPGQPQLKQGMKQLMPTQTPPAINKAAIPPQFYQLQTQNGQQQAQQTLQQLHQIPVQLDEQNRMIIQANNGQQAVQARPAGASQQPRANVQWPQNAQAQMLDLNKLQQQLNAQVSKTPNVQVIAKPPQQQQARPQLLHGQSVAGQPAQNSAGIMLMNQGGQAMGVPIDQQRSRAQSKMMQRPGQLPGQFLQPNFQNLSSQLQSEQAVQQRAMSIVSGASPSKLSNVMDKVKQENVSFRNGPEGADEQQHQFNQLSGAQNEQQTPQGVDNQDPQNSVHQATSDAASRRNQHQEGEKDIDGLGLQNIHNQQQQQHFQQQQQPKKVLYMVKPVQQQNAQVQPQMQQQLFAQQNTQQQVANGLQKYSIQAAQAPSEPLQQQEQAAAPEGGNFPPELLVQKLMKLSNEQQQHQQAQQPQQSDVNELDAANMGVDFRNASSFQQNQNMNAAGGLAVSQTGQQQVYDFNNAAAKIVNKVAGNQIYDMIKNSAAVENNQREQTYQEMPEQQQQQPSQAPISAQMPQGSLTDDQLKMQQQVQAAGLTDNSQLQIEGINCLAECCASNGDYKRAIEYFLKIISIDPVNGPAWTALGHCYLLVEDLQNSFQAYQRALYALTDIKDSQLWYGIGILYEKFESYDHAISALIAVLKMSPQFYQKSEVLYKLGMIFAKTNQLQHARKYFQDSVSSNTFTQKRKTDTIIKIGLLFEHENQYDMANRQYEMALVEDRSNYKLYQHLAWTQLKLNKIDQALDYIKQADELKLNHSDSQYIRGRCAMEMYDYRQALELFTQATESNPKEAAYWTSLALIYFKNGDYCESFENIIKASTLLSCRHEVWYNLGILYEKCKQPEEAMITYQKVQELQPDDADSQSRIQAIQLRQQMAEMNQMSNHQNVLFDLNMKQPEFHIPNSLVVLKRYRKKLDSVPGADGQLDAVIPNEDQQQQLVQQLEDPAQIDKTVSEQAAYQGDELNQQQQQQQPMMQAQQQMASEKQFNAQPEFQQQQQPALAKQIDASGAIEGQNVGSQQQRVHLDLSMIQRDIETQNKQQQHQQSFQQQQQQFQAQPVQHMAQPSFVSDSLRHQLNNAAAKQDEKSSNVEGDNKKQEEQYKLNFEQLNNLQQNLSNGQGQQQQQAMMPTQQLFNQFVPNNQVHQQPMQQLNEQQNFELQQQQQNQQQQVYMNNQFLQVQQAMMPQQQAQANVVQPEEPQEQNEQQVAQQQPNQQQQAQVNIHQLAQMRGVESEKDASVAQQQVNIQQSIKQVLPAIFKNQTVPTEMSASTHQQTRLQQVDEHLHQQQQVDETLAAEASQHGTHTQNEQQQQEHQALDSIAKDANGNQNFAEPLPPQNMNRGVPK